MRSTAKVSRMRHDMITALRRLDLSLTEIATRLGLKDHTSVLYHLNGNCRCEDRVKNGQRGLQK
jgi:chromosomal replication initiation ATPase DnaA